MKWTPETLADAYGNKMVTSKKSIATHAAHYGTSEDTVREALRLARISRGGPTSAILDSEWKAAASAIEAYFEETAPPPEKQKKKSSPKPAPVKAPFQDKPAPMPDISRLFDNPLVKGALKSTEHFHCDKFNTDMELAECLDGYVNGNAYGKKSNHVCYACPQGASNRRDYAEDEKYLSWQAGGKK